MQLTSMLAVEPGQDFVVDRFRAEDGPGVASLFLAVYGEGYPIRQYYDPDWLAAANASGELYSVVARTPRGDIVAHCGGYRSSAPNPALYEAGLGLTLPDYRSRGSALQALQFLHDLLPALPLIGFFGETVCNHVGMQKIGRSLGAVNTGVEIDLMPADAYAAEKSAAGRVSCLLSIWGLKMGPPQTLHVPAPYQEAAGFAMAGLPGERTLAVAAGRPATAASRIETRIFDFAAVSRCQLAACGDDFAQALAAMERQADDKACTTRQVFLNLGDPAVGAAADWLRRHGYFWGGLAPCWFGSDGLLLQKTLHAPGFASVQLLEDRSRQLLALVEADWREVTGGA